MFLIVVDESRPVIDLLVIGRWQVQVELRWRVEGGVYRGGGGEVVGVGVGCLLGCYELSGDREW